MLKKKSNEERDWPLNERIEVEWVDSCTNGVWAPFEHHLRASKPTTCRTIGYLLVMDNDKLVVAQSMSQTTFNISDTMAIPRSVIKKMKKLKGLDN